MSTVEKLFVQIFERKNWIIEQAKQQTEIYNQYLASKLLVDGITPPSWLWNPTSSSDSKELNKEELISKLLRPYPQHSVQQCNAFYPSHHYAVTEEGNRLCTDEIFTEIPSRDHDGEVSLPAPAASSIHQVGCVLNCVPELDICVKSPDNSKDESTLNIHDAHDQSLARIHRSKSRQRDLELRNSTKAQRKSALGCENIYGILSSSMELPISSTEQVRSKAELTDLTNLCYISYPSCEDSYLDEANCLNEGNRLDVSLDRIAGFGSHVEIPGSSRISFNSSCSYRNKKDASFLGAKTRKRSPLSISDSEPASNCNKLLKSNGNMKLDASDFHGKEKVVAICFGNNTSESYCKNQSGACSSRKADSCPGFARGMDNCMIDYSDSISVVHVNVSQGKVNCSGVHAINTEDQGRISEDCEIYEEKISTFSNCEMTRSCNSNKSVGFVDHILDMDLNLCSRKPEMGNHPSPNGRSVPDSNFQNAELGVVKSNAKSVANDCYKTQFVVDELLNANSDPHLCSRADQSVSFCLDCSRPKKDLESYMKRPSSDSFSLVEQNKLDFNAREEVNSQAITFSDAMKRSDNFTENFGSPSEIYDEDLSFVVNHLPLDQQPLHLSEFSDKAKLHTDSLNCNVQEHHNSWTGKDAFVEGENRASKSFLDYTQAAINPDAIETVDMTDIVQSKTVHTLKLPFDKVTCGPEQRLNTFAEQRGEEEKWSCSGKSENTVVALDPLGKKMKRSEFVNSVDNLCAELPDCLIGQLGVTNPICADLDKIKHFPDQESQFCSNLDEVFSEQTDFPADKSGFVIISNCSELDNWSAKGRVDKNPVVSHSPARSRNDGSYLVNSSESYKCLTGGLVIANPICVDKIKLFSGHDSPVYYLGGEVSSKQADLTEECHRHGEELILQGRLEPDITEPWTESNRKNIDDTKTNSVTSYPYSEKYIYSIQNDSVRRSLENSEVDVNNAMINATVVSESKYMKMDQDEDTYSLNSGHLCCMYGTLQGEKSPPLDGQRSKSSNFSPKSEDLELVDESMPVFEGFSVDEEANFATDGMDLAQLGLPRTTIERASIIAEICRSASMNTPLSHFTSAFSLQGTLNPFQSLPNGLTEHLDLSSSFPSKVDGDKQHGPSVKCLANDTDADLERMSFSVGAPYSCTTAYDWTLRIQHASPVGKLRERLSSHTESSGKRSSSNLNFTCFPIEEDPCVSEDLQIAHENADDAAETVSLFTNSGTRQPLKDLTNIGLISFSSASLQQDIMKTDTVHFFSTISDGYESPGFVKPNPEGQCTNINEKKEKQLSSLGDVEAIRNQISLVGANGSKKAKESINNSVDKPLTIKTSMKRRERNPTVDSKRNNIISNISSFIPLVQKKQAADACAGKREIKVKALEAAESAKLLEEKRMNERKKRREAIKLERAKLERENLRKMELERKKKEEERKKKDADIILMKRLRDEEEKKEKERKRMRVEAKQRQKELDEQGRAEKANKEKQHIRNEKIKSKESWEFRKEQNQRILKGDGVSKKTETRSISAGVETNNEEYDTSLSGNAILAVDKSPQNELLIFQKRQENSYEISPYRSDIDDEEDVDLPTTKKSAPWARDLSVSLLSSLLQEMNPDVVFSLESFCSIDEVLLPRKIKQKQHGDG